MTYLEPKGYAVMRVCWHEDDLCEIVTWRETREEAEQWIAEHPPTSRYDLSLLILNGDFTVGEVDHFDAEDAS